MKTSRFGRARLSLLLLASCFALTLSGCAVWDSIMALFKSEPSEPVVAEQPCAERKLTPETAAGMEFYDSGILLARNMPYAVYPDADPNLTSLDLYAPDHGACHPIVVFIHGGGWIGGDKRFVNEKPRAFVQAGYLFASVNYRLSPKVAHPVHVQDVARAIRKIRELAPTYGGDPDRIYLVGHSAGAHLAALVATDSRYLGAEGLDLSSIRGVVLLDGPGYDMVSQMTMTGGPEFDRMYRMAFTNNPEIWRQAAPITYVTAGKHIPPFLMFHTGKKQATGVQAEKFAQALAAANVDCRIVDAQGRSHANLNSRLGLADDAPTRTVFDFLAFLN